MSRDGFQFVQRAFSAHLRDPAAAPRPTDVPEQRMRVYRELVYNNVEDILARAFPVMREVLGDEAWHALLRSFLTEHRCRTPYFREIPAELVSFLKRTPPSDSAPYLPELAHYEWVELALEVAPDPPPRPDLNPEGDLLGGHPYLSPLAWPLSYQWPVHHIGPEHRPAQPPAEPTHLLALRDEHDQVQFIELNAATAALLNTLRADSAISGLEALQQLVRTLPAYPPEAVLAGGRAALEQLRAQGAILGTTKCAANNTPTQD